MADIEVRDVVRAVSTFDWLREDCLYIVRDIHGGTLRLQNIGTYDGDNSGYYYPDQHPNDVVVEGTYIGKLAIDTHYETNFKNVHWFKDSQAVKNNRGCHCHMCKGTSDALTDADGEEETREVVDTLLDRQGTCSCSNPMCTGPHSFFHTT